MKALSSIVFGAWMMVSGVSSQAATWTEGVNYFAVQPPRPTSVPPGKVEVTEIFSYACPACNLFQPTIHKLKQSLPANAVLDYCAGLVQHGRRLADVPTGFPHGANLGIEQKAHDAMFDAVWKGGGDLSILDSSRDFKTRMPTIEDAAKFYSQQSGRAGREIPGNLEVIRRGRQVRSTEDLLQDLPDRSHTDHHRERQVSHAR